MKSPVPSSIAGRLIMSLSLIAITTFGVCAWLLHEALQSVLMGDESSDLQGKVAVVRRFIAETAAVDDVPILKRHLDATSVGGRFRWSVWIVSVDGRSIYGGDEPPRYETRDGGRILIRRADGVELRGTRFRADGPGPVGGSDVYIGMDPRPRTEMLSRFDHLSAVICTLGVIATVVLSVLATRRGLQPIADLSKQAESIGPESLALRLPLPAQQSELRPLATKLNEALGRVEESWQRLEAFSANVAHELRTPLSVMISGAEIALSRTRRADELREVIAMQLEELRGMGAMVNEMLFLAKASSGRELEHVGTVSLRQEALNVADYVEALLLQNAQSIQVTGDCDVVASDSLVRRAIVNLVMNAIRHAPAGAMLSVLIEPLGDEVGITVTNPGEAIPPEDQRRMFDRFWRAEASRVKSGDRCGLGLAIVKAVAMMHGGRTLVSCAAGLTRVGFSVRRTPAPTDWKMGGRNARHGILS